MNSIADFFKVWIWDIISYPSRFIDNLRLKHRRISSERKAIEDSIVYVGIHEWGGYPAVRQKCIKGIRPFTCGLKFQIDRFSKNRSRHPIKLTVTMSEPEKYHDIAAIEQNCDNFIPVSNLGMDFSGYSTFYDSVKHNRNAYIILSNSSVNEIEDVFLDDYIDYMENNKDVAILGVSNSSKYYHTLVRNNFNPHLQSFFLLTTIDVLNQIVNANGGMFPGINECNKHLLIRKGEVGLSRIALKLGYNLAVVTEKGSVVKFNYKDYPMGKGDLRIVAKHPNRINPIRK